MDSETADAPSARRAWLRLHRDRHARELAPFAPQSPRPRCDVLPPLSRREIDVHRTTHLIRAAVPHSPRTSLQARRPRESHSANRQTRRERRSVSALPALETRWVRRRALAELDRSAARARNVKLRRCRRNHPRARSTVARQSSRPRGRSASARARARLVSPRYRFVLYSLDEG